MTGNGTPRVVMGNGEGWTTIILTNAESLHLRTMIASLYDGKGAGAIQKVIDRGIQRATDRIKAEFDQKQKRRKSLKDLADATVQKGKP